MRKKQINTKGLNRRSALLATGAGLAGTVASTSSKAVGSLDLSDPAVGLEAFVKLRGSTAHENVYQVYSGNIFQAVNGEVPRPIIGFWGLQKTLWRPDGDGDYHSTDYDLGLYVDPESREVLDTWENHITGESNKVMHYRSGPSEGHASLAKTDSRTERYTDLWQITGDNVTHESTTARERVNFLQPDEYPLGSTGERFLTSTSYTMFGRMKLYRGLAAYGISAFIVKPVSEGRLKEAVELAMSGYWAPIPSVVADDSVTKAPESSDEEE